MDDFIFTNQKNRNLKKINEHLHNKIFILNIPRLMIIMLFI